MELPHKVGIAGLILTLCVITFGWGIFPYILTGQIDKIKGLAKGSESRQFWEKVPFSLDFKIYLFNVTNGREVQESGALPHVDEIGPYYFDEWKEKVDVVDYDADDTASFYMMNTFVLNLEKSAPLNGKETIIMPHPLLLGILAATERDTPAVLSLLNKALPALFNNPETVLLTTTPLEILFDGITVNCSSKDFAVNAVCGVLTKKVIDLIPDGPNIYKYSIFGKKNATKDPNQFRVFRGIADPSMVGVVQSLNGKKKLPYWNGRPCNDIRGTDSTVFPPAIKKGQAIWSYSVEICRSLPALFERESEYKGIEAYRHTVSLGDMSVDPSLKCFCPKKSECLKKGTMDLMACTGAPVVASAPHFYDSAEEYLKGVHGLRPEKDKHEICFDIEPLTGTPLYAKKRLMFSMPVHPIPKISLTQNVPDTLAPLFWVEESLELNDQFVAKIDNELFRIIRTVDITKWLLLVVGALVMVAGIGLYYKRKNAMSVTPTSTSTATSASKRGDTANQFLESHNSKKSQDVDLGHTNYGYI